MTPYEAVYGQLPNSPTSYLKGCSKVQAVDQLLQHSATMLTHLRENLHQAQNRMKQQVDEHRSERHFQEGIRSFYGSNYISKHHLKTRGVRNSLQNSTDHIKIQTSLPKLDEEGSIWLQPEQVLDTRVKQLRGRMIKEVLFKWKDTSPEDATWEPATILQQFPQLQP
eukprot:PITA_01595